MSSLLEQLLNSKDRFYPAIDIDINSKMGFLKKHNIADFTINIDDMIRHHKNGGLNTPFGQHVYSFIINTIIGYSTYNNNNQYVPIFKFSDLLLTSGHISNAIKCAQYAIDNKYPYDFNYSDLHSVMRLLDDTRIYNKGMFYRHPILHHMIDDFIANYLKSLPPHIKHEQQFKHITTCYINHNPDTLKRVYNILQRVGVSLDQSIYDNILSTNITQRYAGTRIIKFIQQGLDINIMPNLNIITRMKNITRNIAAEGGILNFYHVNKSVVDYIYFLAKSEYDLFNERMIVDKNTVLRYFDAFEHINTINTINTINNINPTIDFSSIASFIKSRVSSYLKPEFDKYINIFYTRKEYIDTILECIIKCIDITCLNNEFADSLYKISITQDPSANINCAVNNIFNNIESQLSHIIPVITLAEKLKYYVTKLTYDIKFTLKTGAQDEIRFYYKQFGLSIIRNFTDLQEQEYREIRHANEIKLRRILINYNFIHTRNYQNVCYYHKIRFHEIMCKLTELYECEQYTMRKVDQHELPIVIEYYNNLRDKERQNLCQYVNEINAREIGRNKEIIVYNNISSALFETIISYI